MPKHELPIISITQVLENDTVIAEALFFPETLRLGDDEETALESLDANLKKIFSETPLVALHHRHPAGQPETDQMTIEIDPPAQSTAWRAPVKLKFSIIRWSHGEHAQLAYVPAINLEVVATRPPTKTNLDRLTRDQIHAALGRLDAMHRLNRLIWLQRAGEITVSQRSIEVSWATPKQIVAKSLEREENRKSSLSEAATDLRREKLPAAFEIEEIVGQLAEALTGRSPRSVLLVGRSGVGKTAAVQELVRRRADFQLGHTPFWATSGSRLVAGMSGFGQWQERCQKLWREAAQERAILHLGNLIELMDVGKSISNNQGIASFLRPYIARGDVLAIAECTPEQLALIERADPRLIEAFYQIKIDEPSAERSRSILLSSALSRENGAGIELEAIERIDQLHRRYATYSAYPGRPLRFLDNLLEDHRRRDHESRPITAEEVTSTFSRETGLPLVLLDESLELELEATRSWFSSRVIGQPEPVNLIVDLLATVKAGLTRPGKPIASLLFIGPTGVGKTEMAKSLAEFLFQDRGRMVRFDMSEYSDPLSVTRLIGGDPGSEGLLTSKVREQPFAVLLLDEFEKAHPSFFDLLLQVLGEGRLTDSMGRVADFSNTVVIMTSNLGADSFQRGLIGFEQVSATRQAASRHFQNAVRRALRPEMYNRIDRIVPFAPLDEETVLHIAEREIDRIRRRDGILYRGVTLNVRDGVTRRLSRTGYDPRYGARPLKREIERKLLTPLSEALNQHTGEFALIADLSIEGEEIRIKVRPATDDKGKTISSLISDRSLAGLARQLTHLRREAQSLSTGPTVLNLQNEIYNRERIEKSILKRTWKNPLDLERVGELPKLRNALQAVRDFSDYVNGLEQEALLAAYGKRQIDQSEMSAKLNAAAGAWKELLLATYALRFKRPNTITLAVYSEDTQSLFTLAGAYYALSLKQGAKVDATQFMIRRSSGAAAKKREEISLLVRKPVEKIGPYLLRPQDGVIGIAFEIGAPLAYPRLADEDGLHIFTREKSSTRCLVHTSEARLSDYLPPDRIERRGAIGNQDRRRTYNYNQSFIEDVVLGRRIGWPSHSLEATFFELIDLCFLHRSRTLLAIDSAS